MEDRPTTAGARRISSTCRLSILGLLGRSSVAAQRIGVTLFTDVCHRPAASYCQVRRRFRPSGFRAANRYPAAATTAALKNVELRTSGSEARGRTRSAVVWIGSLRPSCRLSLNSSSASSNSSRECAGSGAGVTGWSAGAWARGAAGSAPGVSADVFAGGSVARVMSVEPDDSGWSSAGQTRWSSACESP